MERRSGKIFGAGFGGHQDFLIGDVRRRRLRRHERQLEVVDDAVHYGIVGKEGNDAHPTPALGTEQGVDLVNLPDHGRPPLGRDALKFLLDHTERKSRKARLPDFPPMGVGVEAEITDGDLAFVGDMGSDPGDELQVVHPLHLFTVFSIPVADLALLFIEGEALEGKERPAHIFSHLLGLFPGLSPHQAMDRESRMAPGENALRPFRAEQFLPDKKRQDLAGEDLRQPRVVDPWQLMEEARLVRAALGHQEMEVGVEIDPVPKCLDGRNDSRRKLAPGHHLEIMSQ